MGPSGRQTCHPLRGLRPCKSRATAFLAKTVPVVGIVLAKASSMPVVGMGWAALMPYDITGTWMYGHIWSFVGLEVGTESGGDLERVLLSY